MSTGGGFPLERDIDETGHSPSTAIITAVADASELDATELDPLVETLDPDALDTLYASGNPELTVSFAYHGWDVTLRGDGRLLIHPQGSAQ